MKRIVIMVAVAFFCFQIHAENVTEVLMGYGHANDIEKGGLNAGFTFYKDMNYMFSLGINPSMSWFQWDRVVLNENGSEITETKIIGDETVIVEKKTKANAFVFPILAVAKVQYPVLRTVIPYINGGLGYSIMPLNYKDEDNKEKTDMYQGFSWKAGVGVAIRVPDIQDFRFIADVSYRSLPLSDKDNFELDMSGVTLMLGIQYGKISEKGGSPSKFGGW